MSAREFLTVTSGSPSSLKKVYPSSSKSFDWSEPRVLNYTLISEVDFFAAAKNTLIDVAGVSNPIPLVR